MAVLIWRFILIYILYACICAILIFISYNILRRDIKDRLNQLIASVFLSIVFSLIINFIYASISNPQLEYIVTFMHTLSIYFITVAAGFLLLFTILLHSPEGKFSSLNFQIIFLIVYNIFGIGLFFITDGVKVEILPNGIQLYPVWNLVFFIYFLAIIIPSIIVTTILSLKIYKKIRNDTLAKRMKLFIIGLCCVYYMALAVGLTNFLNIDLLRNIFTLTQAIPIIGVLLIYYSVGTSLRENY